MKLVQQTYITLKLVLFVLYIIMLFGIWNSAPKYLNIVTNVFMTFIAVVLIYFFNPWNNTECNRFQRNVAFSAGSAILFQLSIFQYLTGGIFSNLV